MTATHTALGELVDQVRDIVGRNLPPQQITELVSAALRPLVSRDDLLTEAQRVGDENGYRQHILHVEGDGSFSIVSLVWLPGQRTPVHDHVAWCVVGVHQGEETETQYRLCENPPDRYLHPIRTSVNRQHTTCGFAPPGDIHEVWNSSDRKTISIHVYGADIGRLGSSIRRCYALPRANGSS